MRKQVVRVAICAIVSAFSTTTLAGGGQTFALNLGGGGAQEAVPAPSADVVKVVARGVGRDKETGLEAAADAAFRKFACAGEKRLMMDVGQEMKMNTDDEWISIDKIIRDVNRDMKLAVEVERRQELNATLNL